MSRRVGIYSGTFDPAHAGHVAFALAALRQCKLDEVIFLPEQSPRGKQSVTDIKHRIAILERATAPHPNLRVIALTSARFTVAITLPELRNMFNDSQLTLLLGSDVVGGSLKNWPDLSLLFKDVSLAIGLRDEHSSSEITTTMRDLNKQYGTQTRYICIRTPYSGVTSSQIRNDEYNTTLDRAVSRYIQQHKLYA